MNRAATFKMPNEIIINPELSPIAKKVAAVLYSRVNVHGALQNTQEELANIAQCFYPYGAKSYLGANTGRLPDNAQASRSL